MLVYGTVFFHSKKVKHVIRKCEFLKESKENKQNKVLFSGSLIKYVYDFFMNETLTTWPII